MSSFKDLRIVDNFYQTSAFFPMPTILISTVDDEGKRTLGAYSLCFPYCIAGKDYYAMILECRNSSNTAQNILKRGKCALNFLEDSYKDFKETVKLGFPGQTPKEKMANCKFEFEKGLAEGEDRPLVLKKAYQVFECSWDDTLENAFEDKVKVGQLDGIEGPYRNFNGVTSKFGCHFILKIDKILMKERFYNAIVMALILEISLKYQLTMDIEIQHIPGIQNLRNHLNVLFQMFNQIVLLQFAMLQKELIHQLNLLMKHVLC